MGVVEMVGVAEAGAGGGMVEGGEMVEAASWLFSTP